MPSKKPQTNFRHTKAELAGYRQLADLLDMNLSETIRFSVNTMCRNNGIEISEETPKPGTYERRRIS